MKRVRETVSVGLKERQIHNLPVRQPLQKISTTGSFSKKFQVIIGEELNVKEIKQDKNQKTELVLDIKITPELKQEGDYRELLRTLQDLRKKQGLTPSDTVALSFEIDAAGRELVQKFESDIKKTVLASKIEFQNNEGVEIKAGDLVFKVKIDKIQ